MIELNRIYNESNCDTMRRMEPGSVDLVVTSPPYDELRTYKGYEWNFEEVAKELYRILKPGGVVVWVVNDSTVNGSETLTSCKQKIYFRENCGFNIHDTMLYRKKNFIPLTHNRYEQEFEYTFILSKGRPKTFNPIIIETLTAGDKKNYNYECGTTKQNSAVRSGTNRTLLIKEQKIKGNIWEYTIGKNQSSKDDIAFEHPAIFPEDLARDHIISWSNEGDLVYDPFMGSGTVAKMCIEWNRNYVGSEISQEYCQIAERRLKPYKDQLNMFNEAI